MSLKERVYSVLVVSAAEKMNTALSSLLVEPLYRPVRIVSNVSAARRAWNERSYDFIIINSPLPDDMGVRFAIDAAGSKSSVVLLLIRADFYEEIYDRIIDHGVFGLAKPVSLPLLSAALGWMASTRDRLKKLEEKTLSFEEKMDEIRIVNRAKWLLISALGMDEPQAHRTIEKQAMDRCISKKKVAEEIINTYSH